MLFTGLDEVFLELRTIVGLNSYYGERGDGLELHEEVFGISGGTRLISISESESGREVNSREQVAFESAGKEGNRVYFYQVTRLHRPEAFSSCFPDTVRFPDVYFTTYTINLDLGVFH